MQPGSADNIEAIHRVTIDSMSVSFKTELSLG